MYSASFALTKSLRTREKEAFNFRFAPIATRNALALNHLKHLPQTYFMTLLSHDHEKRRGESEKDTGIPRPGRNLHYPPLEKMQTGFRLVESDDLASLMRVMRIKGNPFS